MSEVLAQLEKKGSGGGYNIYNFPNMSDASAMTIYSNRLTNVTKNGIKKIDNDYYIELEGTTNLTLGSNSNHTIANFPNSISISNRQNIEMLIQSNIPSIQYMLPIGNEMQIQASESTPSGKNISARIIVHT